MATRSTKHPPGTEPRENGHATEAPTNANGSGGSVLRPPGGKTTARDPVKKNRSPKKSRGRKLFGRSGAKSGNRADAAKGSAAPVDSSPEAPTAIVIPPPGAGNGGGNGNGGPPVIPAIPPAGKPPKPKVKKLRILFIVLGLLVLGMFSAFFGMFMAVSQDLPAIEKYAQYKESKNSIVTDSQGEFISTLSSNENRILILPEQISPNMKNAVVAIEDSRFYEHRGVDYQGLGRALIQDIIARSAKQGASTITQQLIKQALEAQNDRSPLQKMREMALAYHIEQEWTKDKILTEYLNTVYFGSGAYGVEAAARTYFGNAHPGCGTDEQPCAELLTPAEAAMLAGIIQNPYGYDPAQNPDASLIRRDTVLQKMYEQDFITEEQFDEGTAEALPSSKDIEPPSIDSKAPYYTEWIRQQLVDRYGAGRAFFGGLKVKASLDLGAQAAAENAVTSTIGGIGPDASVVIINNKDATVDAMVAGPDFDTAPFNLATQGYRQPGSTVKPFVLTTALEQGISPDSVWDSSPQYFEFGKAKNGFEVKNYGGFYNGPITLADATTLSDNAVYSQVGLEGIKGGPRAVRDTIKKMGVSDHVGKNPAMVLGTSEVTPLQWTYAFSTLANDGRRVSGTLAPDPGDSPVGYTKVADEDGKSIKGGDNEIISTGVIDPDVAITAKGILHTVVTEGTGKNANIGDPEQWGKTGTTDDNTNAWFCGAITEITACVWVGYAEGYTKMLTEYGGAPVDGGTYPAIIWARVVEAWQALEATRAAEREAEAAAEAAGEEVPEDTEYVAPTDDYVAPTTTAPAPSTAAPAPAPTP
ncbi:MAG: transglycosylase domain-containing protein [Solirubrobacterales bacterium]